MLDNLLKKIIGSKNDRELKRLWGRVQAVNALEPRIQSLSDDELRAMTPQLKERVAGGASLDEVLPEAFAVVREASRRVLKMRHFDVQLIGGMVLHEGKVAEMRTGEGKTLTATLPLYLNALTGRGCHLVTVNDYLARRDAEWMGRIYQWLGLTVGVIQHGLTDDERRAAYACDITYCTNNEIGFDYLRDNMKWELADFTQRGFPYAIVDEVDSILIDEARTPLIIAGSSEEDTSKYFRIDAIIPKLKKDVDYKVEEKDRTAMLTDEGIRKAEGLLGVPNLYDPAAIETLHGLNQALLAHNLYKLDVDYMVKDKEDGKGLEVVIVDEFTGRLMPGRRWSNGLHQAIEAKEGVEVNAENQTLATVTFQNFFRMYEKLAGMTGTAETEATELHQTYKLEVVIVPTNMPMVRRDFADIVYSTHKGKTRAIVEEIKQLHASGQPVLVGTISIERSEQLAEELKKVRVPHVVLNAKHHEKEAEIVAQAGRKGAVTIATNMAGRGTDIMLGGNPVGLARLEARKRKVELYDAEGRDTPAFAALVEEIQATTEREKGEVIAAGGLHIIGTERHESRRIDNQLRGRSGRQGDPGASKFFLSLQDDLMRIFGSDRLDGILTRLGLKQGEAIAHPWVNKALEKAQQKVEARNFEIRKNILKYDDVMNAQRKAIFEQRIDFMRADDVHETVADFRHEVIADTVLKHIPPNAYAEQWDVTGLKDEIAKLFNAEIPVDAWAKEEGIADEEVQTRLIALADTRAAERAAPVEPDVMRRVEKQVLLQVLDSNWREHIVMLDHLRQYVGLRGYAQRDPLNEFKTEAFELFQNLLHKLRFDVTRTLLNIQFQMQPTTPPPPPLEARPLPPMRAQHIDATTGEDEIALEEAQRPLRAMPPLTQGPVSTSPTDPATWGKVSRNAACPCGSGKKFKHCHGAVMA